MFATTLGATLLGVRGRLIRVETHVHRGLPAFQIVGLPDLSCREARDRVRAAVQSSGLDFPMQRITVNLAPSGVPKLGTGLDLAIAISLLAASDHEQAPALREAMVGTAFVGELGLDGSLRPTKGTVPMVMALRDDDAVDRIVVPAGALADAALVPGAEVVGSTDLAHLLEVLDGDALWCTPEHTTVPPRIGLPDIAEVRGQPVARHALEVAAAGGHHSLFVGPPGAGKTMLASRLPGILPHLDDEEALEVTSIWSAAGTLEHGLMRDPPFRAPHHTATAVSLVGGGSSAVRPGEVSLAHRGVLFMDELGEFPAVLLDTLRQPLEEGVIRIARARGTYTLPAHFQLIAATNPCPCGLVDRACRCSLAARRRYARRLSGPLLDRFDIRLDVAAPNAADLFAPSSGDPSVVVAERVAAVRQLAAERGGVLNARLSEAQLARYGPLSRAAAHLLERAVEAGKLTGRGVQRIRRVARTIADLEGGGTELDVGVVAQAMLFRSATTDAEGRYAA